MDFRLLKADEIDVRVGNVSEKGCTLLLYKDARCDMNILDETVGALNWQRTHSRDNANCTVSIYDKEKGVWVGKEDTGTESNTEKEKGLASDSFKRACFNWGIGRELYTSPFIFVSCETTKKEYNGKPKYELKDPYAKYQVSDIEYSGKAISNITIKSKFKVVFSTNKKIENEPKKEEHKAEPKEQEDIFTGGKYKGETYLSVLEKDRQYIQWCVENGKDEVTKEKLSQLLNNPKWQIKEG